MAINQNSRRALNLRVRRLAVIVTLGVACGTLSAAADSIARKVGEITWHPKNFVGRNVTVVGYVLAMEKDFVYFSDERTGKITAHDLAVTGLGIERLRPAVKYVLEGNFLDTGLKPRNGSAYHLELTGAPQAAK